MSIRSFRWRGDWRLTALTVILLPLLVVLGYWQLGRAEEKAQRQAAQVALSRLAPTAVGRVPDEAPDYTPLRATGRFDNARIFLLDNRIHGGRYGFEVIVPFATDSGDDVLVNRGWIAGDPGRRSLPSVPPVEGTVTVDGHLYREPAGVRWIDNMSDTGWPQLIQYPLPDELAARLQMPVRPFLVRLNAASPGALEVDWPVINQSPAKHIGYAVQWFGLAATLLLGWLLVSTNLWQLIRGKE